MPIRLIVIASLVFIAACAQPPRQALSLPVATSDLPPIAAEFETTVFETAHDDKPVGQYRWRFWRSADRVETLKLDDQSGEIWHKQPDGEIGYQQVFHQARQAIVYFPGDFKAIGLQLDWQALSLLIQPQWATQFVSEAYQDIAGQRAMVYQSATDDKAEMAWLAQLQIPARLKQTQEGHYLVTQLVAVYPLAQSPWARPDDQAYQHTDFADIGDKESDPFIKSILHKLKGGHPHGSHPDSPHHH